MELHGVVSVKEVDEIMKRYELFGGIAWYCFCTVLTKSRLSCEIAKLTVNDLLF